mgnify:CR=1 FL=1
MSTSISQIVINHVKLVRQGQVSGTLAALEMLELEKKPENNAAGNIYLAALWLLAELEKKLEDRDMV